MERMEAGEVALTGWHVHVLGPDTPMEGGGQEETLPGGGGQEETLPGGGGPPPTATWKSRQRVNVKRAVSTSSRQTPGRPCPENNARERSRVRTLRQAFLSLQAALPSVPPDTKLSKLDVLVLATSYIAHLSQTLRQERTPPAGRGPGYLHPMKKWPMRSRLYAESLESEVSGRSAANERGQKSAYRLNTWN